MGPTELLPGSHQRTNHRAEARRDRPRFDEAIVYQHASHGPALLGMEEGAVFRAVVPRGGGVIFDDRILHRGGANASADDRWVGYLSYDAFWARSSLTPRMDRDTRWPTLLLHRSLRDCVEWTQGSEVRGRR